MQPDQNMRMIRIAINGQRFRFVVADDAADVFLQALAPTFGDQALPALYRKNNLDVNLGVGVGHGYRGFAPLGLVDIAFSFFATKLSPRWGSTRTSPLMSLGKRVSRRAVRVRIWVWLDFIFK